MTTYMLKALVWYRKIWQNWFQCAFRVSFRSNPYHLQSTSRM
jgi:hypothetical protein